MNNVLFNYFNRPGEYKNGQIWHCNQIGEDIVISDVDNVYIKRGIIRGMILSNEVFLGDKKDLKFKPTGYLKDIYSPELVLLRVTDGPLHINDLSFYKGDIPKNICARISTVVKYPVDQNPVQMEFSTDIIEKLRPLWDNAFEKDEEYLESLQKEIKKDTINKILSLRVLQILKKDSLIMGYKNVAADDSSSDIRKFWEKEKNSRKDSIILYKDSQSAIRLTVVEGRLYFTAQSERFKKISDVKLVQNKKIIIAKYKEIIFGKEKRIFTPFIQNEFVGGKIQIMFDIDNEPYSFTIELK